MGNLKFAALDVFEKEPPDKNNPLLHHAKVFATPHCAWNTEESITEMAVDKWTYEARAEKLPKIIENYHTVERDMFFTAESKIELPEWI